MKNEITINGEIYIKESYIPERTLKKLGKIEEKPWPQEGDEYWFIGIQGRRTVLHTIQRLNGMKHL